jgi:hypothetical protein
MFLHIAGLNHYDPTHRAILRRWLTSLFKSKNSLPSFVAIEWDKGTFKEVKRQRPAFRQLLREEWPTTPSDLLDVLGNSLGYEGDAHEDAIGDLDILWLDEGRQTDPSNYANHRLAMYKDFLGRQPMPGNTNDALSRLSDVARQRAASPSLSDQQDQEREIKWARLLRDKCESSKSDWAIVLIGANHAGPICSLLENHGLPCDVTIL